MGWLRRHLLHGGRYDERDRCDQLRRDAGASAPEYADEAEGLMEGLHEVALELRAVAEA